MIGNDYYIILLCTIARGNMVVFFINILEEY